MLNLDKNHEKRLKITRTASLCFYTYKTANAAQPSYEKLAILYFEGKATDEEELRLLEFIKESARNKAEFAEWEEEWTHSHTPDARTEAAWEELKEKMRRKREEQDRTEG